MRTLLALAATGVALAAAPAAAGATSYCAPETGDYCYAARVTGGVARLTFSTFSFGGKVKTCVRAPDGRTTCRRFTLHTSGDGIHTFTKRWSAYFPNRGRGRYRVTYAPAASGGAKLGPGVSFRR